VTLLCNCVKTNLIKVWSNKFKATKWWHGRKI
jgi:hypothetical protein